MGGWWVGRQMGVDGYLEGWRGGLWTKADWACPALPSSPSCLSSPTPPSFPCPWLQAHSSLRSTLTAQTLFSSSMKAIQTFPILQGPTRPLFPQSQPGLCGLCGLYSF